MIHKIAHRGNTRGRDPKRENSIEYVNDAARHHFVELDVWYFDGELFLGHDTPQCHIPVDFLKNEKFFCHAKNIEALHCMLGFPEIHCFWHENDSVALTSKGFVWKYPEVYYKGELWGVCSDWL